ncbi:MAG TPA: phosphohistidine phosphatase SixA [Bacteroidota bacterium]|nr:phosphohistidine phosphatase SixA [Bacteroidota bacterium]
MTIYLMRHGEAITLEETTSENDADRTLTIEGKEKLYQYSRALSLIGVSVDLVLTSPYKRAYETALIISEAMQEKPKIEECELLKPGEEIQPLINHLNKRKDFNSVLIVGHEPYLGNLASILISGKPSLNIRFKKGGICKIDISEFPPKGIGELVYLLTPKILKSLKKK